MQMVGYGSRVRVRRMDVGRADEIRARERKQQRARGQEKIVSPISQFF